MGPVSIKGWQGRPLERERLWGLRAEGLAQREIARRLGVSPTSVTSWVRESGGIRPRRKTEGSGRFLTLVERETLAIRLAQGWSQAAIARELGRHRSTISREVARNSDPLRSPSNLRREYWPSKAQRRAEQRARRPKPAKLRADVNGELHQYVQTQLTNKWSPEQISNQLAEAFPDRPEMRVSHETIYQALYVQGRGALRRELTRCLRTGRALRRPTARSDERRPRVPAELLISNRPAEVSDRAVPGHWEGDLILGAYQHSAIGTLVERATRFVMLLHLPDGHGAEQVRDAMIATIGTLPQALRRSVTWDQGSELARHAEIRVATDVDIWFCDPHSPWQRGSNENTNGLLRQYFPKGTDLRVHSAEHLVAVADELNGRPRKTLGWKNPREALTEFLVATTD